MMRSPPFILLMLMLMALCSVTSITAVTDATDQMVLAPATQKRGVDNTNIYAMVLAPSAVPAVSVTDAEFAVQIGTSGEAWAYEFSLILVAAANGQPAGGLAIKCCSAYNPFNVYAGNPFNYRWNPFNRPAGGRANGIIYTSPNPFNGSCTFAANPFNQNANPFNRIA